MAKKAFVSYSHEDKEICNDLCVHLANLINDGLLEVVRDCDMLSGDKLDEWITERLENCCLFLLLISPDYFASDSCQREMKRALERNERGDARVIPIIVRPCDWKNSPLQSILALPHEGKPITEWENKDQAYLNIICELRRMLEDEPSRGWRSNTFESIVGSWESYFIEDAIGDSPHLTQEGLEVGIQKDHYRGKYTRRCKDGRVEFDMEARFIWPVVFGNFSVSGRSDPISIGIFQLEIFSNYEFGDGYCTWYDSGAKRVVCSRNIWIRSDSPSRSQLHEKMRRIMEEEILLFQSMRNSH